MPLTVGVSGLFYIKVEKKGLDIFGGDIILLLLHLYSGRSVRKRPAITEYPSL